MVILLMTKLYLNSYLFDSSTIDNFNRLDQKSELTILYDSSFLSNATYTINWERKFYS